MSNYHETEQLNEVEALECLYYHPGEFIKNSLTTFALNLVPFPDLENENHVAITLFVTYTPKYPEEAPEWRLEQSKNLSTAQIMEIENMVIQTIEDSIGACMIYTIADQVQNWLIENNNPQLSMHDEMMNRIEDKQENSLQDIDTMQDSSSEHDSDYEGYRGIQNITLCDPEDRINDETFFIWAENFKKEMEDSGVWKKQANEQCLSGREMFEIDSSLMDLYSFTLNDQ